MKKLTTLITGLMFLVGILMVCPQAYSSGTATVTLSGKWGSTPAKKRAVTIAWVDDTSGTTATITASSMGIEGWYLYSCETNPGSTAPTDNYDITISDSDGVDVMFGALANRDTSNSEIAFPASGYPLVAGNLTFSLSGNSVNNALGTCTCVFLEN